MARTDLPETIVAATMRIEGELKSNGNVTIDGAVIGKVHTTQSLTVGINAEIDADVIALSATISGVLRGNVNVKNSVIITETGKIIGNINCGNLVIREGGYFSGNCRMTEKKVEPNGE